MVYAGVKEDLRVFQVFKSFQNGTRNSQMRSKEDCFKEFKGIFKHVKTLRFIFGGDTDNFQKGF